VKAWIKTWFFDVETQDEYDLSRREFFVWLTEQTDKSLPEFTVIALRQWIINHLSPYESMWLNYTRLFTGGLDQRTTSIGEALHWSMKSGFDKVFAAMAPEVAANTMMNKSERKGKKIENINADQVQRNKLWTNSPTEKYLTDFCENKTAEQWKASLLCKVIRLSEDMFLVFTPTSDKGSSSGSPIPTFYRIRIVRIIGKKYATCSCGLPARMRYPCRHIMVVIGEVHPKMFYVRWLLQYGHSFERDHGIELTKLFREMETEQNKRDEQKGEHILVDGFVDNICHPISSDMQSSDFEVGSSEISSSDEEAGISPSIPTLAERTIATQVKYWFDNGVPIKRGQLIPIIQNDVDEDDNNYGDTTVGSDIDDDDDFDQERVIGRKQTQQVSDMFRNDIEHTQQSQEEAIIEIGKSSENKDQVIVSLAREGLKCVDNDPELYTEYKRQMQKLIQTMTEKVIEKNENTSTNNDGLVMVETGESTKKVEKRKRNANG